MKKQQTFPMKRTAYIEFASLSRVVIGTTIKPSKTFSVSDDECKYVDLVNLVEFDEEDDPAPFFAVIDGGDVEVYYSDGSRSQPLGSVTPGTTMRFTCVVPEVA